MEGFTYWIAAVQDDDGLHASGIVWGESYLTVDDAYDALPDDVREASEHFGLPVQWFGPLTLPAAC